MISFLHGRNNVVLLREGEINAFWHSDQSIDPLESLECSCAPFM